MNYLRSFLFAPGSNAHIMRKALNSTADAVILDLEDAVSVSEKKAARNQLFELLKSTEWLQRIYIRINGWETPWGRGDLEAAITAEVDGIMLPKAETTQVIAEIAELLPDNVDFIPLVETARGVLNAYEIASSHNRISRLAFGAVDFSTDIGTDYSKSGIALLHARSQLVLVSRVAGLLPPVDTVFPDLLDTNGLAKELDQVKQLGMFGKLAIHPKQLDPIHTTFTPGQDEIREAREIVQAFEEAELKGVAALEIKGKFIDYPVYRYAQKVVFLAEMLKL